jgi:carbonic anhydrase
LRHGEGGLKKVDSQNTELSPINQLSQYNVIQQIEHLKSYPIVQDRLAQSKLQVHAWWFDLSSANVLAYDEEIKKFTVIDEAHAGRILERL